MHSIYADRVQRSERLSVLAEPGSCKALLRTLIELSKPPERFVHPQAVR